MATGPTLPDRFVQLSTEKLVVGMGTSCHTRMSRDKPHLGLELRDCSSVSASISILGHLVFLCSWVMFVFFVTITHLVV